MFGTIHIQELIVYGIIGVYPTERVEKQPIFLDLALKFDITKCIKSDAIEDTIDYDKVKEFSSQFFSQKKYFLLETCAYEFLIALFKKFPLHSVKVSIRKKQIASQASIFFELEMERE